MLAGLVNFVPKVLLTLAGVLGISRVVGIADVREETRNGTLLIQNWYQNVFLAVCIYEGKKKESILISPRDRYKKIAPPLLDPL